MNKKSITNFNQDILFRELTFPDFIKLHQMYDKLTFQSRRFFNLYWLGLKSKSLKWYLAQIPLFLSTMKIIRFFLKIVYPHIIFLCKIASYHDRIVCFGFLIIRKGWIGSGFSAELGVATDEDYRGLGFATKMIDELIDFGKSERLKEIYLHVRTDNSKAISIYQKKGFIKSELLKDEVEWNNKKYDMFKMVLAL